MSYKKTANSNAIRSCGALSQRDSRFSDQQREQFDNRWYQDYAQSQRSHKTQVYIETPKTIISHNQSPDVRFEQSINPYRGLRTWLYLLLR
jgi:hypothetical protein